MTNENKPLVPKVLQILFMAWGVALFTSLFLIRLELIGDWFVLLSVLLRAGGAVLIFRAAMDFFNSKKRNKIYYKAFRTGIGYAITLMYFFAAIPVVVNDFYLPAKSGVFDAVVLSFNGLFPILIYLLLILGRTKVETAYYTQKEVNAEKALKKDKKKWKRQRRLDKKGRTFPMALWQEIIDPIAFALIAVVIIQHFSLQLFQIPSESMVPEFVKNDRVLVNHLAYGPYVPMTRVRFPSFDSPKTGDIVTWENPKMYDRDHYLSYPDVLTAIFQPLVYRLTVTMVDLDQMESIDSQTGQTVSQPKPRLLVKRVLAEPGEQLCIVNDDVYKRIPGESDWTLLEEGDFGRNDVFSDDFPLVDVTLNTKAIREYRGAAIDYVNSFSNQELNQELSDSIASFKAVYRRKSPAQIRAAIDSLNNGNVEDQDLFVRKLYGAYSRSVTINSINRKQGNLNHQVVESEFNQLFSQIPKHIVLKRGFDLQKFATALGSDIDKLFENTFYKFENDSPYEYTMKRLNALYQARLLDLFTFLLEGNSIESINTNEDLLDLSKMHFYLYGFSDFFPRPVNYFAMGNLPNYPQSSGIPEDNYFLVGDNRYYSLDNRFAEKGVSAFKLNPQDTSPISVVVKTNWDPHTIGIEHILGKMAVRVFPLNRIKLFF